MHTPEQILEMIRHKPYGHETGTVVGTINLTALASYLASIQPKEECSHCEGLGYRTVSVEQDNGIGEIEKVPCGKRSKPKEEEKVEDGERNCVYGSDYDCKICPLKTKPSLLSIPRPKGWRVGQTLENFREYLKDIDAFYLNDKDIDRYYQEFLKSLT